MSDRRNNQLAIAQDEQSGASLVRMLVVGLVLIVIGMFAVVLIV
jgi:hypothetical protein